MPPAQSYDMDSIPPRLGDVEQQVHTLQHRVIMIEQERLPHRVSNIESSMEYLTKMAETAEQTNITVVKMNSFVRGGIKFLSALIGIAMLLIALIGVLPKISAIKMKTENPQSTPNPEMTARVLRGVE